MAGCDTSQQNEMPSGLSFLSKLLTGTEILIPIRGIVGVHVHLAVPVHVRDVAVRIPGTLFCLRHPVHGRLVKAPELSTL